jgi:general secretion pathway protein J
MRHNRAHDGGYTLIEALASLAILAMVSVMIMSGLGTSRRLWERPDLGNDPNESVEATQAVVRHLVEHAFALVVNDSSSPSIQFEGTAEKIDFLGPAQDSHRPSEIQRYRLTLAQNGDLVLSSISDLAADPDAPPHDVVLMKNIQSLDLDYFGPGGTDGTPQWQPTWKSRPSLPKLVRLRLNFMPGDMRWWPTMIVSPAASVDLKCGHSVTGQCGALL